MSILLTYEVLKNKDIKIYELLSWHFQKILNSIRRKISPRERYHNPWMVIISREIKFSIFWEYFRAVRDYHTAFGRTCEVQRTKKGLISKVIVTFTHLGSFKLQLQEITGKSSQEIKASFKKKFPCGSKGEVIVNTSKPTTLIYKKNTETLDISIHYEVHNRYGVLI